MRLSLILTTMIVIATDAASSELASATDYEASGSYGGSGRDLPYTRYGTPGYGYGGYGSGVSKGGRWDPRNEGDCQQKRESALIKQNIDGLRGVYIPECTATGEYEPKQCHLSTGYCWCVDPTTGKEILGTRKSRLEGEVTCDKPNGGASFTVSSTGPAAHYQSEKMGVYHSTGQTYYNFPVYKKTAGSVEFLFVDSYGYWSVNDHLNPTHSGLYHPNSGASSPPVTGWKYGWNHGWYDDHQLTVTQTGGGGGGVCHVEHNIAYYYNTVTILWRRRQQACADSCGRHRRCHFWTFKQNWNRCWIKTSKSGRGHGDGFVSGNKACGIHGSMPVG